MRASRGHAQLDEILIKQGAGRCIKLGVSRVIAHICCRIRERFNYKVLRVASPATARLRSLRRPFIACVPTTIHTATKGQSLLLVLALLPLIGALAPALAIRAGRNASAVAAGTVTLVALVILGSLAPAVLAGEVVQARIDWLPAAGAERQPVPRRAGPAVRRADPRHRPADHRLCALLPAPRTIRWGGSSPICCCSRARCWASCCRDNILLLLVFWELTSLVVLPADRLLAATCPKAGRARAWR